MASKLAQFMQEKAIDPRRVVVASQALEARTGEDRAIRSARKKQRSKEDGAKKPLEGLAAQRPHSGHPVSTRVVRDAAEGKVVSGPVKTRILRAVNRILEQKKQEAIDLRALF